jgi:hypothetical protein
MASYARVQISTRETCLALSQLYSPKGTSFSAESLKGTSLFGGVTDERPLDLRRSRDGAPVAQFVGRNEQRELRHCRVHAGTAHGLFAAYR